MNLKFELKQIVKLKESGETGTISGRCELSYSEPSYLVDYKAGDGRQVSQWIGEHLLEAL